ncbi:MAG: hypothetical protein U9O56_05365 [Campylobacterota bacterium]|nr:hypothetical protein [Campylobacterota bacterium]
MKKLTIAIDMGAKNNGVFIVKSDANKIIDKKATNIIVDNINFSKKSRRENRHKDRNYKRRKLAKRLLKELINIDSFDVTQQELILGLLNNRGYTFISTSTEFEQLNDETVKFIDKYLDELKDLITKDDFDNKVSSFEQLEDLRTYIYGINEKITIETKKKKAEFYKEFQAVFATIIKKDLQNVKKLFTDILKELDTGSKPRKKYLSEIKEEIEKDFDFIEDKQSFFNLVGNISNLQLRVLRKFYNYNSSHKDRYKILKTYFVSHHYKSEKEKEQRKELFKVLNSFDSLKEFLQSCESNLTIPPYEDMNNRDTYKCNSMLIKPEIDIITDDIKEVIDFLLSKPEFSNLLITNNEGVFEKEELIKTKVESGNKLVKDNFTYSKYLQRILDTTEEITSKELNPRNVFKHKAKFEKGTIDSIECFKKVFTPKVYNILKPIAEAYYKEEEKIHNGIYEESTSILVKCNTNTPYKNNAKHILLKPIYSYSFSEDEADKFLEAIKDTKGLQTALQRVSEEGKKYQNSFYHIIEACYNDEKCVDDKDIKLIVKNLDKNFIEIKALLENRLDIKTSCLKDMQSVTPDNLKRVINIFKQTYEILFKELGGFNKTCKHCTKENAIRSDETLTIGKRLLSDVAKPIDGMLDMMLDRLAYEIIQNIEEEDIQDISTLEILLEQNRFEFEENLNTIKRSNNSTIKKYKNENKDKLNIDICPYSGKSFDKGDYDHILPQKDGVYNSKANMIYCSVEGNQKIKGSQVWSLELIKQNAPKHLKTIFKTDDLDEIKSLIKKGIDSINIKEFTNFDNLKLHQQIALRYALFLRGTDEFKKAFEIVRKDKIKTFSNGTQKRLARFVNMKLAEKFPQKLKNIEVNSKTIDNQLVRTTRNFLADSKKEIEKQEKQNSHSHCIDAMVVFYLANSKIKGRKDRQKENVDSIEPIFSFDNIFLSESGINNIHKNKTFINSPDKELGSYKLFDDTIYSENYKHISKENTPPKNLELLIKHSLLYINDKGKKIFIDNIEDIKDKTTYKLDVQKVSNTIYTLFNQKNKTELTKLKFLDKLQYATSRKEIQAIFFDEKQTKLLEFEKIKNIPYFSIKLYKAVCKKLQNETKLFNTSEDGKTTLNYQVLESLLKDMFESKQKEKNKEQRKRGKKRHKYTLPILGSPTFRIKRGNNWQVLGNKDIATKNYIIDGNIKPIYYFTQNTIPLKIEKLLDCLLIDENSKSIYEVEVNIEEIKLSIKSLKYLVSEAKRCNVIVTFNKKYFDDIQFENMDEFNCAKNNIFFNKFVDKYIEGSNDISKYIGSMRNNKLDKKNNGKNRELNAVAKLLDNNSETITLQYTSDINSDKKKIILDNLKD